MTEEDVIAYVAALPGVEVVTASEDGGAPKVAWGDTFFFAGVPGDHRFPFATVVTKDYPGFDTASGLDRPGVFRVNVAVGRRVFEELFGYPPAGHAARAAEHDYAALDRVLPHPVYAVQGWACVVNPGEATAERLRALLAGARDREAARHGR